VSYIIAIVGIGSETVKEPRCRHIVQSCSDCWQVYRVKVKNVAEKMIVDCILAGQEEERRENGAKRQPVSQVVQSLERASWAS
jgi:hypothetical protein